MTRRLTDAWQWIRSIAGRGARERGLDEELQFHIDQQTEKYVRAGMDPAVARRQALRRFGGVVRAQEETRDQIPRSVDPHRRALRVN